MTVSGITETALYLTFELENEDFAIDVSQVREVLDMTTISKVPRSPDFMRGVINVRGSVVPVMDLRTKFGLPLAETTVNTRIVIMEINMDDKKIVLGAVADSVNDVLELEPNQIEDPPEIGSRWRSEFIKGIGKQDEKFVIILDVDRVFSTVELAVAQGETGIAEAEMKEEAEAGPEAGLPAPEVIRSDPNEEAPAPV